MGVYLNPGNSGFLEIINSDYVDKTGLIGIINKTIGTKRKLTCISRPRRFGKSYAAQMLTAYYGNTCDSHPLFDKYRISKDESYEKYINHFHVISLDVTGFISEARKRGISLQDVPEQISVAIKNDVETQYPELGRGLTLNDALIGLVQKTGKKIVFIIDEWDSMIRETSGDSEAQGRYLNLLMGWFKNNSFTPVVVAAGYMTGILPIKKDGSQSAISDFEEYSVLEPGEFAGFVGFTEEEVKTLCMDKFEKMKPRNRISF